MNRLARIYAQTGDANRTLNFLEKVVTLPNSLTYGGFKLEQDWDPVRNEPRFEKIVASLAPKEAASR